MTTPLSVEFLLDAVRVVFPGRRTARRTRAPVGTPGLHTTRPTGGGEWECGGVPSDFPSECG